MIDYQTIYVNIIHSHHFWKKNQISRSLEMQSVQCVTKGCNLTDDSILFWFVLIYFISL